MAIIFFSELLTSRVREVSYLDTITTVVGNGIDGYSGDSIVATSAELNLPYQVTIDVHGDIYIADGSNNRIRKVDEATRIISTIAGNGASSHSGDGGPATDATINNPVGVCADKFGNIYFSSKADGVIRRIDSTGIIHLFAGVYNSTVDSGDGGPATAAGITALGYICADKQGNIYMVDGFAVRKVDVATGIISRFAGTYIGGFSGDGGPADTAEIQGYDVTVKENGEVYIADTYNDRIRMVDTMGIIHTVVGTGVEGFSGDGGPADSAELYWPEGVAFDPCGNLYIGETGNSRIRKVTFINPDTATIYLGTPDTTAGGDSTVVNATLTNAGAGYKIVWYKNGMHFDTTTTPSLTYANTTKENDTITATVIPAHLLCTDSSSSNTVIAKGKNVGISSVQGNSGFSVYPNPAHDVLHIEVPSGTTKVAPSGSPEGGVTFVLQDVFGTTVVQGSLTNGINSISIATLPPGVYFFKVDGVYVTTVVKE
jgi:Secretion system C-terminal sorting domain